MLERTNTNILHVVIAILALADGVLHFSLEFAVGFPFPLPGAPDAGVPPFIHLLSELFLLNFLGAVVLVGLFWFGDRWLGPRRWLIDVAMIAFAAATLISWWMFGRHNPMGLGYLSLAIEVVLIVSLVAHMWTIVRPQARVAHQPG